MPARHFSGGNTIHTANQGTSRYGYCLNNPVAIVDPTGRWGNVKYTVNGMDMGGLGEELYSQLMPYTKSDNSKKDDKKKDDQTNGQTSTTSTSSTAAATSSATTSGSDPVSFSLSPIEIPDLHFYTDLALSNYNSGANNNSETSNSSPSVNDAILGAALFGTVTGGIETLALENPGKFTCLDISGNQFAMYGSEVAGVVHDIGLSSVYLNSAFSIYKMGTNQQSIEKTGVDILVNTAVFWEGGPIGLAGGLIYGYLDYKGVFDPRRLGAELYKNTGASIDKTSTVVRTKVVNR
jgi:hypothetical protein